MERGFTLLPSVVPDLVSWVCGPGQRPALVGSRGEADVVSLAVLGGGGDHFVVVPIAPWQGIVCTRRGTSQVREKREGSEAGALCEYKCCKIFVGGVLFMQDYARINPAMFKNFSVIFRIVVGLCVLVEEG